MEKLQKLLPTPLVLITFLLSFVAMYCVKMPIFQDPDIGWHIAAGDLIRSTWQVPMHDPWSFSGSEQTWYNLSWLWDVWLSFIHQYLGMEGLFLFAKLCPALLVAVQVCLLQKRGDIGTNAIIFTALITSFCMMEFAYGRPQIFGLWLLMIFHHILHKSRSKNVSKALFLLPFLMVIWANVHGSFFTAFAVLGAFGLEAIYERNWKWLRHLLLISFLCCLALLVNPYGIYIFSGVLRTLHSVMLQYVTEWHPFVFGDVMGASMWVVVFIYASNLRTSNAPLADKILALVSLFSMFFLVRNVGVLAVLGAPYLAANMPADDNNNQRIKRLNAWVANHRFSPIFATLVPLLVVGSYLLLPVVGKAFYLENPEKSPVAAIKYVAEHYAGKRVLNDYNLGGRMIYETAGKIPLFVDGRAGTVYTEKILNNYLEFMNLDKTWEKTLESYNINVMIVEKRLGFAKIHASGGYSDWKEVFRDDVAIVYERK